MWIEIEDHIYLVTDVPPGRRPGTNACITILHFQFPLKVFNFKKKTMTATFGTLIIIRIMTLISVTTQ